MSITILFENEDWMPPLRKGLDTTGLDYKEQFVDGGILNLGLEPEEQIVINRMSPSSHTRGHQAGVTAAESHTDQEKEESSLHVQPPHGSGSAHGSRPLV